MKRMSTLYFWPLLILLISITPLFSQSPKSVHYQAVARDGNNLMTNQTLEVRFTISNGANAVYQETHSINTNALGLFNASIGGGITTIGNFETIDWANGNYNLKVELDPGTGFLNMGTTTFASVPYSLLADKADMALEELNNVSVAASAPGVGDVLEWDGTQWVPGTDDDTPPTIYVAGTGIDVSGTTITNTAPDQAVSLAGAGSTTISGTYPNFTISSTDANTTYSSGAGIDIFGTTISNTAPDQPVSLTGGGATTISGTYPNFTISSTDANTTYSAGTGIDLTGNVVSNTGDTDASDDLTIGTLAAGDLGGSYPAPSVSGLQGNPVSTSTPATGQVLKWNGSSWSPDADNAGSSVWNTSGTSAYYSNGDVGIGTSSIDAKAEIFHNSSLSDPHLLLHENGNDYARLRFQNNNGSNYWAIASYIASNNQNDRLNFWNGTSGDVMTITGDGEVGIGVGISPKVPFHVGNDRRVLFGTDTLGNGDKLMFLPDLHAFRVGTVAAGAPSTYWNRDSIGLYSFASGLNTRAQGYGATAMGRDTEASNSYAFASGYFTNADGQFSTAMGYNTDAIATGSTALGYNSDANGNYSTAIGLNAEAESFASVAVGRYNVGLGNPTSWVSTDPIFEIGIGTSSTNRSNAMTVRKNGNVGIGTTVPGEALQVNGKIRFAGLETLEDGGANEIAARADLRPSVDNSYDLGTATFRWDDVYATNGTIITSDRRDKTNIRPLNYGMEEIMQIQPVRFQWKDNTAQGDKLGFIAQDLQGIVREVVKTHDSKADEDGGEMNLVELERLGVYYSDLIPVLVKGMQEQQEMIEAQSKEIETLKERLSELNDRIEVMDPLFMADTPFQHVDRHQLDFRLNIPYIKSGGRRPGCKRIYIFFLTRGIYNPETLLNSPESINLACL